MRKIRERFKIRIPVEALSLDWDFFCFLEEHLNNPKILNDLNDLDLNDRIQGIGNDNDRK